ncbi:MAG TPA: Ger(x)C family spore germination protein [Bacillales bacterium]|nr:Ger(x)C family spore germination protein [Bacillales bacterium]
MKNNAKRNSRLLKLLKTGFFAFVCLFLLAGCWDEREIEDRTAITALAVDEAKNGGYKVTIQIAIPLLIAGGVSTPGGGGGSGKPVLTVDATGRTFDEALEKIQYRVDHKLFFGQMTIVVFGRKIATDGIQSIIDALRRMSQIRRLLYPIVVEEGKASDLLQVNTQMEKIPANFINLMIQNGIRMGTLPDLTLGRYFVSLSNSSRQPAMLSFKMQGKKSLIETGIAVFHGPKMVGLLNRLETSNFLRVSKENGGGKYTFQAGKKGQLATYQPNLVDTNYDFFEKNGRVHVNVDVFVEGQLTEVTYPLNLQKQSVRERLKKTMEKNMAKQSTEMVKKLQQYGSDILGFGPRLRAYHYDLWKKIDWDKAFPKAKVNIQYHIQMRRSGMEMKNYRG